MELSNFARRWRVHGQDVAERHSQRTQTGNPHRTHREVCMPRIHLEPNRRIGTVPVPLSQPVVRFVGNVGEIELQQRSLVPMHQQREIFALRSGVV